MVFGWFRKKRASLENRKVNGFTTLLWSYKTGGEVWGVSVSSDGSYVAAGSWDDKVYFFNREGKLLWSYETGRSVYSVSVSSDGSYVAAGSGDKKVYFFRFDSAKYLAREYGTTIEKWKEEGYDVSELEAELTYSKIKDYEKRIQRLKQLENELVTLGIEGAGVSRIKAKLKDPKRMEEVEREISLLKQALEAIDTAQSVLIEARNLGCDISEPEEMLKMANSAFEAGSYEDAISMQSKLWKRQGR